MVVEISVDSRVNNYDSPYYDFVFNQMRRDLNKFLKEIRYLRLLLATIYDNNFPKLPIKVKYFQITISVILVIHDKSLFNTEDFNKE
ncbi:hypothetical protein BCON_0037g00390 [Botryotinia convoluta]|uniref:Uncharacterized protein n=1 Tax=Botryotinia convoluta TaxID=54673 RepID=A0A4Z1IF41_9HELO|nr:hypothetical protein BCON_0037g00390 [Botryotinia convoluta]